MHCSSPDPNTTFEAELSLTETTLWLLWLLLLLRNLLLTLAGVNILLETCLC